MTRAAVRRAARRAGPASTRQQRRGAARAAEGHAARRRHRRRRRRRRAARRLPAGSSTLLRGSRVVVAAPAARAVCSPCSCWFVLALASRWRSSAVRLLVGGAWPVAAARRCGAYRRRTLREETRPRRRSTSCRRSPDFRSPTPRRRATVTLSRGGTDSTEAARFKDGTPRPCTRRAGERARRRRRRERPAAGGARPRAAEPRSR